MPVLAHSLLMRVRPWMLRVGLYGSLGACLVIFSAYCMWLPEPTRRIHSLGLAGQDERIVAERLRADVAALVRYGPRNLDHPYELSLVEAFLDNRLRAATNRSVVRERVPTPYGDAWNLFVDFDGSRRATGMVVVGAHYDTAPGTKGANDNGSGVAMTLEMARRLNELPPERPVRIILFANEEPPHFRTEMMGSLVHAKNAVRRGEEISAMLALESLGYFTHASGSQKYPGPMAPFYPSEGNFVAFVGNLDNRALVARSLWTFRARSGVPAEGGVFPGSLPGIGWSDHWSFWQVGIPALMVTDTAPYRDPNYHHPSDRPENLSYRTMAQCTAGIEAVIRDLARE